MKIHFKLLCCFNSLKSYIIEILIIVLSSIGLLISIIGFIVIPWKYTSKVMEAFYLISLILFIYSLIVSSVILYLRKKNKIEKVNICCFFISLFELFACILSILMYIIIFIVIVHDFKNKKRIKRVERIDPETGETHVSSSEEGNAVSDGELIFAIISIIINILLWIILLFLWISDLIRIKYKINGTYKEYLEEQKNNSNDNLKNSQFNVIGHDKYGFPLFGKQNGGNLQINRSKSFFNYRTKEKDMKNILDTENNNILKYSYKEKFNVKNYRKPSYKSVDLPYDKFHQKEKYIEKYIEDAEITNQYNSKYSNFPNKTILNISGVNNSINPGN